MFRVEDIEEFATFKMGFEKGYKIGFELGFKEGYMIGLRESIVYIVEQYFHLGVRELIDLEKALQEIDSISILDELVSVAVTVRDFSAFKQVLSDMIDKQDSHKHF